ncbi:MAG: hypothetical protein ACYDC9_14400, partial [Dermatophilaceae bacterium]
VAGLVRSRRGGGTRVVAAATRPSARERQARLATLAAAYVMKARAFGATDQEIQEAVGRSLALPRHPPAGSTRHTA